MLGTALGAVIGLGSGLLIDLIRSRRDNAGKWLFARRDAYAGYLSSLHEANEAMRAVSLGEHSQELTRTAAARAAFRAAGVTRAREQVILLAPADVVVAADEAFRCLRIIRDRIGEGEALADYRPALDDYADRLHGLRDVIRRDLGVRGSSPQIPL